ncbi:MAG: ChaN family lipoprotein, partial [Calditrichia bacterium]|nr:ChaN family lipoprotein [Calditrichia bacterium]
MMKNIWWGFIMLMMIISMISAQDEGFDVDRLPLGDVNKKYDFSAVKLDKIFSTAANREISYDNLIASLAKNRIVMVGETHTDQNHHDVQLDIIKGLTEAGKKVCLALEMFNSSQNEALLAWTSGKSDEETFLMESGFFKSWG